MGKPQGGETTPNASISRIHQRFATRTASFSRDKWERHELCHSSGDHENPGAVKNHPAIGGMVMCGDCEVECAVLYLCGKSTAYGAVPGAGATHESGVLERFG